MNAKVIALLTSLYHVIIMLISISELISKSWGIYKTNFKRFIPYMFLFLVPGLVTIAGATGLDLLERYSITTGMGAGISIALMIIRMIMVLWITAAIMKCVGTFIKTSTFLSWRESFGLTSELVLALIVNAILIFLAFFFGFLLLIIPGIIISTWFVFATSEVVFNKQGNGLIDVNALARSKQLVKGRWFDIFFTFYVPPFFFSLIYIAVNIVLVIIFSLIAGLLFSATTGAIIGGVLSALGGAVFAPLPIISAVLLYFSAKENSVVLSTPTTPSTPKTTT